MEPHATIAHWEDERLTLWDKNQWVTNARDEIAAVFGISATNVRVISPFIGGAFGTTLRTWPHATLAAIGARHVGRPVKLVLSRRQMFSGTGCRPETWQRIAIGATRDGHLTSLVHEATAETSTYEQHIESTLGPTRNLYSCPNVLTRYRLAPLHIHTPNHMRGPGEATGIVALECTLDELAYELDIDPVVLRMRNEPSEDEELKLPFSSRSLSECYRTGANRFGWSQRNPEPRSMRDGNWLVGWGVATAFYPMLRLPARARVQLLADGSAVVETASSDMGPGTYTSLTQIAAETLGMAPERVRVAIGDSSLPTTPPHGGSMTMASVGSAVLAASIEARKQAFDVAAADIRSALFGSSIEDVVSRDGGLFCRNAPDVGETYASLLTRINRDALDAEVASSAGDERSRFSMHSFGAVFAEVAVDADLGQTRVRRLVGAYGVGRVINPTLARSQAIGGMVGGIGMTLMEHSAIDRRNGHVLSANLAEYLVPVNADIHQLEAIFVEESDPHVNPLGAKGLGEIALIGVAPAIANAVFHATGRRLRELPITPDKLLATAWPDVV
jgi:xanthine dehydrogenase YagR molybdenum-binding subunit